MIQLQIDQRNVGAAGALKVRWCVPRDVLEDAQKRGSAVHLVLTVAPHGCVPSALSLRSVVVPLKDGTAFISFRFPGVNRIFAHVYYGNPKYALASAVDDGFAINGDGTGWDDAVVEIDESIAAKNVRLAEMGELPEGLTPEQIADLPDSGEREQLRASLHRLTERRNRALTNDRIRGVSDAIDVPEACFAKKWPQFAMEVINFFPWPGRRITDECNRRRRALIAFPLSLAAVPLALLFRALCVLFLGVFLGRRGVNFAAAVRPYRYDTGDVWRKAGAMYWFPYEDKDSPLRILLAPVQPLVLLVSAMIIAFVHGIWHPRATIWFFNEPWYLKLPLLSAFTIAVMVGCVIVMLCVMGIAGLNERFEPRLALRLWVQRKAASLSEKDVAYLACAGDCDALAGRPDRRTVRLWYHDVKARICKPLPG